MFAFSPGVDGESTLSIDPVDESLRLTGTEQVTPSALIVWQAEDVNNPLNLDVSRHSEIVISFAANQEGPARLILGNQAGAGVVGANFVDVIVPAGQGLLRIPISDIDETIVQTRLEDGMVVQDKLPPLDQTSVDVIHLTLAPIDSNLSSTGWDVSLAEIAIVPEPAALPLFLLGLLVLRRV